MMQNQKRLEDIHPKNGKRRKKVMLRKREGVMVRRSMMSWIETIVLVKVVVMAIAMAKMMMPMVVMDITIVGISTQQKMSRMA